MREINRQFGFWESPVDEKMVADGSAAYGYPQYDNGNIYFVKLIPSEGRNVVVTIEKGKEKVLTPKGYNVRSRVYEYGGLSYIVRDNILYFVNFQDQQIYRQDISTGKIERITKQKNARYGDFDIDYKHRYLYCIKEVHSRGKEPQNLIVRIDLQTYKEEVVVLGCDFYMYPRINKKGDKLAFICWMHPYMPWDNSELYIAELGAKGFKKPVKIAGGAQTAVNEPLWQESDLYFTWDKDNWFQIYRVKSFKSKKIEKITDIKEEFSDILFVFGNRRYGFIDKDKILSFVYTPSGQKMLMVDVKSGKIKNINTDFSRFGYIFTSQDRALFVADSYYPKYGVYEYDFKKDKIKKLTGVNINLDRGYISCPQKINYPTSKGGYAWANFYPPKNKDYTYKGLPPVIVIVHGGPTAYCNQSFNIGIQYFTSRGFAVLDVDYRGSYGYGRKYRDMLKCKWGMVDVDDCVYGVLYLYYNNMADMHKAFIRGGSAGGYTTLTALTFTRAFLAGTSYYGISDLELLVKDTHKFESHYLDVLVGRYPEEKKRYQKLSPVNNTELIETPILFLQGDDDKIVPPNQAEKMYQALKKKGIRTKYILFKGEGHGFRKSKNKIKSLKEELKFYQGVLRSI